MSQKTTIENKARNMDMIADVLKEYWYNTEQKHKEIKELADKLEIMSGRIESDEFRDEVEAEGERLFRTKWDDFFGI